MFSHLYLLQSGRSLDLPIGVFISGTCNYIYKTSLPNSEDLEEKIKQLMIKGKIKGPRGYPKDITPERVFRKN